MPLGPVFRYEMLAAGRKRRYFVAAALVGLGMLGLLWIGYESTVSSRRSWRAEPGGAEGLSIAGSARLSATFFVSYAWATLIGVLFVTPVVCAGAIASERERRTIEYLFATDLSNTEIVLDKLVARLMTVAKLVVATLPVLAIFRLLGGVPGGLLLAHFAMLASTATLTAAIALTVGVWCERARDAVPRALRAVFLSLIALPITLFVQLQLGFFSNRWIELLSGWVVAPLLGFLQAIHPIWVMATSVGIGNGVLGVDLDRGAIATMVGLQLAVAAVLLGLCITAVRRVHLNAAAAPGAKRKETSKAAATRLPYELRPMLWKEMFAASIPKRGRRWVRRLGLGIVLLAVAAPLGTMVYMAFWRRGSMDFDDYFGVATVYTGAFGSILVLILGSRAAGLISQERESDTWLSLLTSDLSAAEIIGAKALGNLYANRWAMLGVVLIPLSGVIFHPAALLAAAGVTLVLGTCGWAATAIGLAYSLRMSSSTKAVAATIFTLLGIGLFYSGLVAMLIGISGINEEALAVLALPPLVPILFSMPLVLAVANGTPDFFIVSFALGNLFYAFVGFATTAVSISTFDRICGRSGPREAGQRPTTDPGPT